MTTKNRLLYLICILTDFAVFVEVFTVSRGLAEDGAKSYFLGIVGAGFSFTAGLASILGGLLAHRFDTRKIFQFGAGLIALTIAATMLAPNVSVLLPVYWLQGIGLGCFYPPLISWLNQGEDAHANNSGVSRTLILFCVAWNVGMMGGQLTAGSLFALGRNWPLGVALVLASVSFVLAVVAARIPQQPISSDADDATPHPNVELATSYKQLSWIANLGGTFGASMIIHLLPDLAVSIKIPPDNHGYLLAIWRAVVIATYFVMHYFTFWHYRFGLSVISQALGAAGLMVISQANTEWTLLIGLTLLGQLVGYNYFSGLYYSTAGSSNESRALAAGIHEATLAAGMAFGTIIGGVLGTWFGHRVPYMMSAGVLGVLVVIQTAAWWSWVRPIYQRRELALVEETRMLKESMTG